MFIKIKMVDSLPDYEHVKKWFELFYCKNIDDGTYVYIDDFDPFHKNGMYNNEILKRRLLISRFLHIGFKFEDKKYDTKQGIFIKQWVKDPNIKIYGNKKIL